MKSPKLWEPWFFNNSKVPVFLSYFAPITIWAISFGPGVWCRGEINKTCTRHERIHFQQHLELGFVLQWVLYGLFWLIGLVRYRSGSKAYRENPFEREAFENEKKPTYLGKRKRYAWTSYIRG